jgi:restriction system protein
VEIEEEVRSAARDETISAFPPWFVGRRWELRWLQDRLVSRRDGLHQPVVISGAAGVGKTALVQRALMDAGAHGLPPGHALGAEWFDHRSEAFLPDALEKFIERLQSVGAGTDLIAVLDDVDAMSDSLLERAAARLYNLKRVRRVVIIARRAVNIPLADKLELTGLDSLETRSLLSSLVGHDLPTDTIDDAVGSTLGLPLAVSVLARLLKHGDKSSIRALIGGRLYEASEGLLSSEGGILPVTAARIVSASEELVERLKRRPEAVHELTPRQFEELLAQLLRRMGWEVELTPQTRDGGKDLLAYMDTDVGRLLCLVEAKKYRRDRKVGIGLVRELYGTLCDHQATSAMLVTTSSFTDDARAFQKRHQYHLALRDYGDIAGWIRRHAQK